jgi:hypothetical protein
MLHPDHSSRHKQKWSDKYLCVCTVSRYTWWWTVDISKTYRVLNQINLKTVHFVGFHYKNKIKIFHFPSSNVASPETNFKLAIRPKTTISRKLFLNSVICENKWYVNSICPFFPLYSEHSYDTSAVLPKLFWSKDTLKPSHFFSSQYNFSSLHRVPNFIYKILAGQNVPRKWTESIWYLIQTKFL